MATVGITVIALLAAYASGSPIEVIITAENNATEDARMFFLCTTTVTFSGQNTFEILNTTAYRGTSQAQPEPPQPQPRKYFPNGFGSKHVRFGSKQYRFGSKHCGLFTLLFFHISSFYQEMPNYR